MLKLYFSLRKLKEELKNLTNKNRSLQKQLNSINRFYLFLKRILRNNGKQVKCQKKSNPNQKSSQFGKKSVFKHNFKKDKGS